MGHPDRDAYVEKLTAWIVDADKDPELSRDARLTPSLDHLYHGKSQKIRRLIRVAYLRGVRRGAGMAWDARQPIVPRFERKLAEGPTPETAAAIDEDDAAEEAAYDRVRKARRRARRRFGDGA